MKVFKKSIFSNIKIHFKYLSDETEYLWQKCSEKEFASWPFVKKGLLSERKNVDRMILYWWKHRHFMPRIDMDPVAGLTQVFDIVLISIV